MELDTVTPYQSNSSVVLTQLWNCNKLQAPLQIHRSGQSSVCLTKAPRPVIVRPVGERIGLSRLLKNAPKQQARRQRMRNLRYQVPTKMAKFKVAGSVGGRMG